MMFLSLCSNLRVLDMSNNSITQKENYRQIVRTHIPNLAILDQIPYEDVSEAVKFELSRSDYHTSPAVNSSSSEIIRQLNTLQQNRPSTATPPLTHITIGHRPSTADKTKHSKSLNLSVGDPVCGNIVAKARQPRKLKTAWGDSASSSSSFSCSSDSSNQTTPLNSANIRNRRVVAGGENEEACETLLESARLWREKSRETREKFNDV